MAIKKHRPTSPGRRFATWLQHEAVTKDTPEKSLTEGLRKSGGRNSKGRITSRHRGGGAKRRYRKIDFKRRKDGVPAKVAAIEYDPNRSAHIALLHYADGEKRYIWPGAPPGGRTVLGPDADIQRATACPWPTSPPAPRSQRGADPGPGGSSAQRRHVDTGRGQGRPVRDAAPALERDAHGGPRLPRDCGVLGNAEHELVELGKAGRSRHRGKRPQTRGVAMNPVDHPHGGGEAHKTPGGHPVTPWGVPTLGYRTRKKRKTSDQFIVRGRRRGKKGRR